MPYLLLALGCLVGAYALFRFFMKANPQQIKALFMVALLLTLCTALFFMAVTGRLAAAIALLVALGPVVFSLFRQWLAYKTAQGQNSGSPEINTIEEAYEILGLKDGASEDEIQAAYKKLMQKVHPDHEGSEWMAAKLNAARDLLLKK